MNKIRVAAVSYLNTKPLLYGIKHHPIINDIELTEDYPAKIAQLLIEDKADIGLIPVAVIPKLNEWNIVSDYCIGADGPVASVCIFSEVQIRRIKKLYLDYQSRTSVKLAEVLLKEHWKLDVELIDAKGEDYRSEIKGCTGGVVIGDRALKQRLTATYIYDLGEAWINHTGLPFVFAAWISNKKLAPAFIHSFNEANKCGLVEINKVIAENLYPFYDLRTYFTKNISYALTDEKRKGLALFLEKIR